MTDFRSGEMKGECLGGLTGGLRTSMVLWCLGLACVG